VSWGAVLKAMDAAGADLCTALRIGGNFAGMRIDGASLFEVELDSMAPPA
jgi:uncharacterized protein YjbI with pentapeptide repeats